MSGEKGELFHHDSVFFDPLSFFTRRSGGPQGLGSALLPFSGFTDYGNPLFKTFNWSGSNSPETFGPDGDLITVGTPETAAQATSPASGAGGRIPATGNSSMSSLSLEAAGEGCYKNEDMEQPEEENKEGKRDNEVEDDDDDDDKSKKVAKARKKGEKRPRDQPRFAFMTKSQVDHLEDGYRWRKYGQKAVKNSPFPRSYYRCTTQKCTVKKRVERSFQDPSIVITTYEGQHTHHYPVNVRGSSHLLANPPAMASIFPHDLLLQTLTPPLQQLHFPAADDFLLLHDYASFINSNQA